MLRILKKIMGIVVKILIAILAFIILVIYVGIPLGVPWAVRSQGSKILAHPVSVRSVWLNPFALSLTVKGLKIMDADKQLMVGFNKFWVNVRLLSLLKKEYRIQSLGLDGLNLNVVLLSGNQINLLSLVPQQAQGQPGQTPAKAEPQKPVPIPVLPDVVVDEIVLKNGTVTFTDKDIAPGFSTRLNAMDLRVTGVSTKPDSQVKVVFQSAIDDKGKIQTEVLVKPFVQPLQAEATFSLNNYAMRALSPYVGKYTGRAVQEGGKMDVKIDYRIADNKLNAGHKVLIQRFNFGEKVESKDALSLPFGLAIALLEDPQERIDVSLPVHGDISDPKFEYFHLLGQVAANFFMKLVTAPFKVLFALVPGGPAGTEEMGTVSFAPGAPILADAEKQKVELLVKAMKERPKLSLEINGSYDTAADWKAMKTEAFETEYTNMRKESARTDMRLFEDMYKYRFGMREYWVLERKYTQKKKVDEEPLKVEIRRQIIERGEPQKAALEELAKKRAQAVYDLIVASGFDTARVKLGDVRKTQESMGAIPMEFTLTVFEDKGSAPATSTTKPPP